MNTLESLFTPTQIEAMMRASVALEIAKNPPVEERLFKILKLIEIVAKNGKKKALIALTKEDKINLIRDCLGDLGYAVTRSYTNVDCLEVSWQYATEQTSD